MSSIDRYPTQDERRAPRNSALHQDFLAHLTDGEIADGIAGLPAAKLESMVTRHFPGQRIQAASVTDALDKIGANFEVVKLPLRPARPDGEGTVMLPEMATRVGLYRSDTWAELGSAGPSYGVLQNGEAFAAADVMVANGEMAIQSAQVIDSGARVRLSGLIGTSHIDALGQGVDVLAHFGVFEANHDGIHSTTGRLYTVRLKCFNGMTSADTSGAFNVRHTSLAADRLKEASAAMLNLSTAALEEADCFAELAQRRMSEASFVEFANEMLDSIRKPLVEGESSERMFKNRDRDIADLVEFFEHGAGNVGETGYDAYNAVTEWVTPRIEKMRDAAQFAKKFESQATGYHARTKARALKILTR